MKKAADHRFWPFRPRTSIISSILMLVGLLLIFVVLRATINWPSEKSETIVLIGLMVFSLLPVLLALFDVFIERGGTIEYKGVKINFAQVPQMGATGFIVPTNIGAPGQPVSDSNTTQILDALRDATACDVVIINLNDGHSWWETRLLVLLAGAVRLQRPEKVVFVGTDGGVENCFQGWGHAYKLLRCLLPAHPQYLRSFHVAQAAARQWELVEPNDPVDTVNPSPPQPTWIQTGLAARHSWMTFDNTGLPNPLLAEQLLASELGEKVESEERPKGISLVRLQELFRPVLHTQHIDESWQPERQLQAFFENDDNYIAVTQNNKYKTLISRVTVHNSIVKTLVVKK